MSLHGLTIKIAVYLTTVPALVGRVIMFFKASVGAEVHSHSRICHHDTKRDVAIALSQDQT